MANAVAVVRDDIINWVETFALAYRIDNEDPVFDGITRDFLAMDASLSQINTAVTGFIEGVHEFCRGLIGLSDAVVLNLTKNTEQIIASDCCKFREAINSIARVDAPHSSVAKLMRDLDFNISTPLKQHLSHNKQLKVELNERKKRLVELQSAKSAYDDYINNKNPYKLHNQIGPNYEAAQQKFAEADRRSFEWFMMLEEHKCDMWDSIVQTFKYLLYEFLASSAQGLMKLLPVRMEFRPMLEMTPSQLRPSVKIEIDEAKKSLDEQQTLLRQRSSTGTEPKNRSTGSSSTGTGSSSTGTGSSSTG
eukprot:Lankesteria_metandrocarpae@DN505_c0_g1_i1.p1